MLEVKNLQKSYHQSENLIPVLTGVSFSLSPGESLAVVGASGVGKSTLLHCLGLIETIDDGEVYLGGDPVSQKKINHLWQVRRQHIGFVFQFHYLMAELTALENVTLPLLLKAMKMEEAKPLAQNLLEQVSLGHRHHHRPMQLSGGEQQRVAIARALVHRPQVLLADEPTGNLDPETASQVFDILLQQCQQLKTILVVATHNYELARRLQKQGTLQRGKLELST